MRLHSFGPTVALLALSVALFVMPAPAGAQPDCQTPEYVETLNKNVLEKRIAHIKGTNAIVFMLLDPVWSLPDFDDVPYRHEEDMTNIKNNLERLIEEGVDEVIAWKFRQPGLGSAVAFKDGCAVRGYGEPDMIDKIISMNEAFVLITERGVDDPSVRESIRKLLMQTPYRPDDDKIDAIISKIRPFAGAVHAGECRDLFIKGDYTHALAVCRKAAETGGPSAQNILGGMYNRGLGVTRDHAEAAKWYRKAAEQGYAKAQNNLGGNYAQGWGVTQDAVISLMWTIVAAMQGNETAISNRDFIEGEMTPEDIAKAERLARECVEKNYKGCGF